MHLKGNCHPQKRNPLSAAQHKDTASGSHCQLGEYAREISSLFWVAGKCLKELKKNHLRSGPAQFFSPWSQGTPIINLKSLGHKFDIWLVFVKSMQLASRCVALQEKGRLRKLRISFSKHQLSEALEGTCASLKYLNCCSSLQEWGGTTAASLTEQGTDWAFQRFLEAFKLIGRQERLP